MPDFILNDLLNFWEITTQPLVLQWVGYYFLFGFVLASILYRYGQALVWCDQRFLPFALFWPVFILLAIFNWSIARWMKIMKWRRK